MISARGLCKRFGKNTALDDVTVAIAAGERVGFLGRNGAGKSTLLRVLAGFISPEQGECTIDGIDVCRQPSRAQRLLGFLPEGAPAYPEMRALDYLRMRAQLKGQSRTDAAADAEARLAEVGLSDRSSSPVQTLSKGMRQRLGLADALLGDPRVIILDEPTSGLDPAQLRDLTARVSELASDRALILASHRLDAVENLCSRLVVLDRGRVVFDGAADELAKAAEPANLEAAFLALTEGERSPPDAATGEEE